MHFTECHCDPADEIRSRRLVALGIKAFSRIAWR
jgi:hypothetical protein